MKTYLKKQKRDKTISLNSSQTLKEIKKNFAAVDRVMIVKVFKIFL